MTRAGGRAPSSARRCEAGLRSASGAPAPPGGEWLLEGQLLQEAPRDESRRKRSRRGGCDHHASSAAARGEPSRLERPSRIGQWRGGCWRVGRWRSRRFGARRDELLSRQTSPLER